MCKVSTNRGITRVAVVAELICYSASWEKASPGTIKMPCKKWLALQTHANNQMLGKKCYFLFHCKSRIYIETAPEPFLHERAWACSRHARMHDRTKCLKVSKFWQSCTFRSKNAQKPFLDRRSGRCRLQLRRKGHYLVLGISAMAYLLCDDKKKKEVYLCGKCMLHQTQHKILQGCHICAPWCIVSTVAVEYSEKEDYGRGIEEEEVEKA